MHISNLPPVPIICELSAQLIPNLTLPSIRESWTFFPENKTGAREARAKPHRETENRDEGVTNGNPAILLDKNVGLHDFATRFIPLIWNKWRFD